MKKSVTLNALDTAEKIHNYSKDSKLSLKHFKEIKDELEFFADFCKVGKTSAIIFANALIKGFGGFDLKNIFKYLGLKNHDVIRYKEEISELKNMGLFKLENHNFFRQGSCEIPDDVIFYISENIPFKKPEKRTFGLTDLLDEFEEIYDAFGDDVISSPEFFMNLKKLPKNYMHIPLIQKVMKEDFSTLESCVFFKTLYDTIEAGDNNFNTNVESTLNQLGNRFSRKLYELNKILSGKTKLITKGYIELSKNSFRNRTNARLSKSILKELKESEGIIIDSSEEGNQKIIVHENIKAKDLFFNSEEEEQLNTVRDLLEEDSFNRLQKKLNEKGMPMGLTLLFYGSPGTGKTESVYQLAKESGRNVFKVDMADTKSMWFGESQKLTKKIFTDYNEMKDNEELCPILLFNEADALIGKRKESGSSQISDTENAIQNILLERLENFDGILIATTNLHTNLDDAFERRFLFKIRFDKPEVAVSMEIWKSMLPFLEDTESLELAAEFDFTGGEIQNIARKCLMMELIQNIEPGMNTVKDLCHRERWGSRNGKEKKLGFGV